MNLNSGVHLRWTVVVLASVLLVVSGAVGASLWMRQSTPPEAAPSQTSAAQPGTVEARQPIEVSASDRPSLPDVTVTLTDEAVRRAGIDVTPVGTSPRASRVRLSGVVQPNAYRSVIVTPLVGGRVTNVLAELGQPVRHGQTLADVYSPELAEAQTRYIAARAELEAHERELRRVEKLADIGAASRQELEKIHAEHTGATTMLASARSRLTLLGMNEAQVEKLMSASDVSATTRITAPLDGIVTAREANVGLNVEAATPLFTVVDLSTVWVVGDLYEKDFGHVHVGSLASVTTTAYPDLTLEGKVSYIDPQVKPDTRTAQVRVEAPNRDGRLRLGMYAEMQVGAVKATGEVTVPRAAVQMVGDRSVVYLVNPKERGHFIEREVRLGEAIGDQFEVKSGLRPGDVVVAKGSFSIRAERERLGLRAPTPDTRHVSPTPSSAASPSPSRPSAGAVQAARVIVSDQGYEPNHVTLRAGIPARITFVRTSEKTCGTEIALPSLEVKRSLPLNQPVDVEFTPQKAGDVAFVCGMGMLHGTIVVQ